MLWENMQLQKIYTAWKSSRFVGSIMKEEKLNLRNFSVLTKHLYLKFSLIPKIDVPIIFVTIYSLILFS